MKYNPSIHHRRSIRLKGYDYSQNGAYFITVCAQNRECLFGKIENRAMILNEYGETIKFTWFDLTNHNRNVSLDCFVVMPNHVHGIVMIMNNGKFVGAGSKPAHIKINSVGTGAGKGAGLEPAPTGCGLTEIVRQFKTFSAKRINKLRNTPAIPVWQRNFYEHIIRSERELTRIRESYASNLDSITHLEWPFETWDSGLANASVSLDDMLLGKSANLDSNVREYIMNNPIKWNSDRNNPENLCM